MADAVPVPLDARYRRVEQKLRDAAIALASQGPIESVSVAAVTAAAGVNRATFYNHADSPAQLLRAALRAELDGMRADFVRAASVGRDDLETLWRDAAAGTVAHVATFRSLYDHDFALPGGGPVSAVLSEHITESMQMLFAARPDLLPPHPDGDGVFLRAAYAASIGASITAVLREWHRSSTLPAEAYFTAVRDTLPAWVITPDPRRGGLEPTPERQGKETES